MHSRRSALRLWVEFKRIPSAWLLLIQLCILFSTPFLHEGLAGQAVSWVLSALALILVGAVIRKSPVFTGFGLILVVCALLMSCLVAFAGWTELSLWANIVEAMAYFYATLGMILYMSSDHRVSTDEIFAVPAVFTLLTWGFAFLYSACQIVFPGSFSAYQNPEGVRTWLELLYFSVAITSATGLSDIIAVSPLARVISATNMFCGVMYLALVVSRLVGLLGIQASRAQKADES